MLELARPSACKQDAEELADAAGGKTLRIAGPVSHDTRWGGRLKVSFHTVVENSDGTVSDPHHPSGKRWKDMGDFMENSGIEIHSR